MVNSELFIFSLNSLKHSDWEHFERLSSSFLVEDFGDLRTMASPSGDGGRDSELFSPGRVPIIAAQYSVTEEWSAKIKHTVERITKTFPDIRILIYLSPKIIGAKADKLKASILEEKGIQIDVRDRTWFVERASSSPQKESAAEELIDRFGRAILAKENIIEKKTFPLSSQEAKAALVYLDLQLKDEDSNKGLTKLAFEALTRAALRHTRSEVRIKRTEVHEFVVKSLPSANPDVVVKYVDSALARLTKRVVRHWKASDEFCLTNDEVVKNEERLASQEIEDSLLRDAVKDCCKYYFGKDKAFVPSDEEPLSDRIIRIIESFFLSSGESFVAEICSGSIDVGTSDARRLKTIILQDIQATPIRAPILSHSPSVIEKVIVQVFNEPSDALRKYLRRLSDSYTLFSFLKETPDVRTVINKIFNHGKMWLDTSIILPFIADQLIQDGNQKVQPVLSMAKDSGGKFFVTTGILEETLSHISRSLACARTASSEWKGRVPYLYRQFISAGRATAGFAQWLNQFRGSERPTDDMADYLNAMLGVELQDLNREVELAPEDFRIATERLWRDAHIRRRSSRSSGIDETATESLIKHDIETYLGVISIRRSETKSDLGFAHWLLTLDTIAWQIRDQLRSEFQDATPPSPLMSLGFLDKTLSIGPSRGCIDRREISTLPFIFDFEMTSESEEVDILELAKQIREENSGSPEYLIRRKVRDACDKARRSWGKYLVEDC